MSPFDEVRADLVSLKDAIQQERRWVLRALLAAEAELQAISPPPLALDLVRIRTAALTKELGLTEGSS